MIRVGGDFHYSPTTNQNLADLLLIAGGVGINPLLSVLFHHSRLLCSDSVGKEFGLGSVRLLYSSKTRAELLFKVCQVMSCDICPSLHHKLP